MRGKSAPPDSDPLSDAEFGKMSLTCQANSPQATNRQASSSTNTVNFSSPRTMKRFPSPQGILKSGNSGFKIQINCDKVLLVKDSSAPEILNSLLGLGRVRIDDKCSFVSPSWIVHETS